MITGASGHLGSSLARRLHGRGCEVTLLSRQRPGGGVPGTHVRWDARSLEGGWASCLEGAQGVVNLAGRSVDVVKTPDHCDEILRSRVEATRVLGRAMRTLKRPPGAWVQMSTAHIVGDPPEVACDEDSAPGYLRPGAHRGSRLGERGVRGGPARQRLVILRTSFVLDRGAGALRKLGRLARLGLGGTVGSGRQGMS